LNSYYKIFSVKLELSESAVDSKERFRVLRSSDALLLVHTVLLGLINEVLAICENFLLPVGVDFIEGAAFAAILGRKNSLWNVLVE
jgi:hypothetical protein